MDSHTLVSSLTSPGKKLPKNDEIINQNKDDVIVKIFKIEIFIKYFIIFRY